MMPTLSKALVAAHYHVGWLCAVQVEYVIAQEFLDETYRTPSTPPGDPNSYYCGRMGEHNVVIACLPIGRYGTTSAATCATNMMRSFPNITVSLMVGIGGGVPSARNDVRLGDIVVSKPTGRYGGVIHYEYGKTIQNRKFESTGHLNSPAPTLLNATHKLASMHQGRGHRINQTVGSVIGRKHHQLRQTYSKPDIDALYRSDYVHPVNGTSTCQQVCDQRYLVHRQPRLYTQDQPIIHYGLIASADRLMKDASVRDELGATEGVLCFETEAAGLINAFQCLVIRGICDYSDTHKNDMWQGYAAAIAAAYAKELLEVIPAREVPTTFDSGQMSHQIAQVPASPWLGASSPMQGGEIKEGCVYCADWGSWALGIGCPVDCSQCPAKDPPKIWRKFISGGERYEYWSRDKMCRLHARQRDMREMEQIAKHAQLAAIDSQDEAWQPDIISSFQDASVSQNFYNSPSPQHYSPPHMYQPQRQTGLPTTSKIFRGNLNNLSQGQTGLASNSARTKRANVRTTSIANFSSPPSKVYQSVNSRNSSAVLNGSRIEARGSQVSTNSSTRRR